MGDPKSPTTPLAAQHNGEVQKYRPRGTTHVSTAAHGKVGAEAHGLKSAQCKKWVYRESRKREKRRGGGGGRKKKKE